MQTPTPEATEPAARRAPALRWLGLLAAGWLAPFLEYVVLYTPPKEYRPVLDNGGYYAWFLVLLVLWVSLVLSALRLGRLDPAGRRRAAAVAGLLLLTAGLAWADDLWRARLFGIAYRRIAMHQQADPLSDLFFHWHSPWLAGLWVLALAYLHVLLSALPRWRPRLRQVEVHAALVLLPVLLLGGLFEVAVRLGWVGEPWTAFSGGTEVFRLNPVVGWSLRAGVVTEEISSEFRVKVRTNRLGLREHEVGYARPPGVTRILWLGDSFCFGAGVEADQRFSDRVAAACRGVESINTGMIGYGADQEYLYFADEGHRFQPDLVVLCMFPGNDFYDVTVTGNYGYPKPRYEVEQGQLSLTVVGDPARWHVTDNPEPYSFRRTSRGWQYLERLIYLVRHRREAQAALPPAPQQTKSRPAARVDESWLADPLLAVRPAGYEVTRRVMFALRDACREAGAQLMVMIIPPPSCLQPPQPSSSLWLNDARCQRAAQDICRELGVPTLNTLPDLTARARAGQQLYFPRDGHWTAAAHAAAAELLLRRCRDDRLLPPACLPQS